MSAAFAKVVATAYAQGMTYEQIMGMVKTLCAQHEHETR